MNKTETLQISYEDFFAVLKEWENYTRVKLNLMPKSYPDTFIYQARCVGIDDAFAARLKMSDLADLLWQSLKLGVNKIEEIHSNTFVDKQVEFFKELFSDSNINNHFDDLEEPKEFFFRLGEPAQIKLIHEGVLGQIISKYEKIKPIKERENFDKKCREKELNAEERKRLQVNKRVRELDKEQCIFCGEEVNKNSSRYFQQSENEYVVEKVFLTCRSCSKKDSEPKFGRFLIK